MKFIDADLFLEEISKGATVEDLKKLVTECKGVPVTVGAEPVKHGKWEEKETYLNEGDCEITEWQSARCSKCGKYHTTPYMYSFDNFNFCPNCGAKMKGTEE